MLKVETPEAVFVALFGYSDCKYRELLRIEEVQPFEAAMFGNPRLVNPG